MHVYVETLEARRFLSASLLRASPPVVAEPSQPVFHFESLPADPVTEDGKCGGKANCTPPTGPGNWTEDDWDETNPVDAVQPPDHEKLVYTDDRAGPDVTDYYYLQHEWIKSPYPGNTASGDWDEKVCLNWGFSVTKTRSLGKTGGVTLGEEAIASIGVTVSSEVSTSTTSTCHGTFEAGPSCRTRYKIEVWISKYTLVRKHVDHASGASSSSVVDSGVDVCRNDDRVVKAIRTWNPTTGGGGVPGHPDGPTSRPEETIDGLRATPPATRPVFSPFGTKPLFQGPRTPLADFVLLRHDSGGAFDPLN